MRIKSAVLARVHLPLTFSHCGGDTAENYLFPAEFAQIILSWQEISNYGAQSRKH